MDFWEKSIPNISEQLPMPGGGSAFGVGPIMQDCVFDSE